MQNKRPIDNDFDYDVIIVGCGPAGSITGRYIYPKKNGLRVLILEQKKQIGVPIQCGEGILGFIEGNEIAPSTYDKKGLFECPDHVKAHRIDHLHFISSKKKAIKIPVYGHTLHRDLFDQYLAQRAINEGAEIRKGIRFLSMKDRNTIITSRGEFSANIIVGADGPSSSVACSCGLQPPKVFATCVLAHVKGNFNDHTMKIFYSKIFRMGYAWIFSKGDHGNIGFGTEFYDEIKKNNTTMRNILYDFIKKELDLEKDDVFFNGGGIVPTGGLIPRLIKDNVVLVGDAAGMVHPPTGAGIDSAMVGARECGIAIQRYFSYNEKLINYEKKIKAMFGPGYQKGLRVKKIFQLLTTTDITLDMAFRFVNTIGITKFFI
ncbi:MAG: NAD(P)/FAD-dependent oxidoreductase [Thermoplasmatota archaeon]